MGWYLTPDAGTLLSVVQFDPKKAPAMAKEHFADDGGDYLLVRARVKQSLGYVADVLEALYLGEVEGWKKPLITEDKTADYMFRMIVTRDEWKQYILYEIDGCNYTSHVKEETVKRQPEPKIGNLYSALSATWSAWSKLQPLAPYSGLAGKYGSSYWGKADCKNCDHQEIRHTIKGDKCNAGSVWDKELKKNVGGCSCTKYEPKVVKKDWPPCTCRHIEAQHKYEKLGVDDAGKQLHDESCMISACKCVKYRPQVTPAPAAPKQLMLTEGEVETDSYKSAYPAAVYGSGWDVPSEEWASSSGYDSETGTWHANWCVFWDGDSCICGEVDSPVKDEQAQIEAKVPRRAVAAVNGDAISVEGGLVINGKFVIQEPHVPGETRQESKNRLARNRRARRRARKEVV